MLGKIFRAIKGDKRSPEELEQERRWKKGNRAAMTPGTKAFTVSQEALLAAAKVAKLEERLHRAELGMEPLSDEDRALAQADVQFYQSHYKSRCDELHRLIADPDAACVPDSSDIALPVGSPSARAAQRSG